MFPAFSQETDVPGFEPENATAVRRQKAGVEQLVACVVEGDGGDKWGTLVLVELPLVIKAG